MVQVGLPSVGRPPFPGFSPSDSPEFAGLKVAGEMLVLGGVGFYAFGEPEARTVIYRGGTDFFIARNFNQAYTVFQVWAPPGSLATEREATLAIVRGNEPDVEYFDLYNNGYAVEKQHGIRIQKRGTGAYRDFVFDLYDGATKTLLLMLKADGNIGVGQALFGANAAKVFAIGNGVPPDNHIDDAIQIFSVDSSDGTATLGLFLEQAVENIGTFTPSNKIKVRINGVEYWIQLDAV